MITIADSLEEAERGLQLALKYEQIFCTIGVHPHHAKDWKTGDEERLRELVQSSPRVHAIGEIGLDYHYDFSPREVQREVFRMQLVLARELDVPSVIHCREALEEVWIIVDDVRPPPLVLHCCTEEFSAVERFLERGDCLSFTGIITYPQAHAVQETVRRCPLNRLMVETDAPYLPPEALRLKRGRAARNEPAFVIEVAKTVAAIKGLSLGAVDEATTRNAVEFFGVRL